ncbi:GNAT family N-acetyltransferase [Proteiniborus sp. MB09-C3]|uniref:GNAT family N-acetyltransferase n=1 Tax=Proteiniborus sp. MB09-C3 TaxID=3050072 RepID=UPI0025540A92|nr:GNAT family N-acetyltransferase [Proteiniborus sp. MB09-C3]WIV11169.1 GNAT family N-acetyltransferase [Proteiniborus sp. MB09-C3]
MQQRSLYSYSFNDDEYIEFRLLSSGDSIEELTQLLHKSYKILADMGLNYVAATQNHSITLKRATHAYKCYIGMYKNKIISTISLYGPEPSEKSSWYSKGFVAKFGQFAVAPEFQKYGIGSKMMDIVEEEAKTIKNVTELAIDTAESAHHLIEFYKKREYRYVETIQWDFANYKSVILSKTLYS